MLVEELYTCMCIRIYVYSLYTLYGHMGGKVRFLIMGKGKMEKRLNIKCLTFHGVKVRMLATG